LPDGRGGPRQIEPDVEEVETFGRSGFAGGRAVSGGQHLGHPLWRSVAPAYFDQGADDSPDHMIQKSISFHFDEDQIAFGVLAGAVGLIGCLGWG
jgi:hypothetical protein